MSWEFENQFYGAGGGLDIGTPVVNSDGLIEYTLPYEYYTDGTLLHVNGSVWLITTNTRYIDIGAYNTWNTGDKDYDKLSFNYYFDNNVFALKYQPATPPDTKEYTCYNVETPMGSATLYNGGTYATEVYSHVTTSAKVSATKWYDTVYIAHGTTEICAFDVNTHKYNGTTLTLPVVITQDPTHREYATGDFAPINTQLTIGSNICAADNKLFITCRERDTNHNQYYCVYDLATHVWTYNTLPGRHQLEDRHIIDGLDGAVWVTNKNNHAIIKIDTSTKNVTSTIRVNRHPYRLAVSQGKELFVASDPGGDVPRKDYPAESANVLVETTAGYIASTDAFNIVTTEDCTDGQISLIDQSTGAQDPYAAARCNGAVKNLDFFDDGQGYLWFATDKHIGRLKRSDLEFKTSYSIVDNTEGTPTEPQYNMIPDNSTIAFDIPSGHNIIAHVVTPPIDYQQWTGTTFVDAHLNPYMYILIQGKSTDKVLDRKINSEALYQYWYELRAVRLSALVSKDKYIHRGTAMIAIGDQAYYGD